MYNINLYSYWKKPFSRGKNFAIHPLDEPGKEKYFSTESHCTHYLKRTDPFVFKSILGVDYNTLIRQQKEDIQTLNTLKTSKELNTLQNSKQNEIEKDMHKTNYITTEENEKNETEKNNYNNRYNTYGNEDDLEHENQKKFRTFKSQKIMRPYHRERNFKDIYGYENLSLLKTKPGKYLNLINNIKYNNLEKEKSQFKRRYDGYTSYEIPLIPLSSGKSQKNIYFGNKLNYTLDCLKKKEGGRNAMDEEELKQNLFRQTSKEFLKKNHLPDVLKIAGSTQLIRRQKIGLSKEMGERYNPYSLFPPSKNRTGRNYVGDLFKH
jgi:hypothetical protein